MGIEYHKMMDLSMEKTNLGLSGGKYETVGGKFKPTDKPAI
jgi:hypothetical protein